MSIGFASTVEPSPEWRSGVDHNPPEWDETEPTQCDTCEWSGRCDWEIHFCFPADDRNGYFEQCVRYTERSDDYDE